MSELYNVRCPKCGWGFYVSPNIYVSRVSDCICPKCHHEFPPAEPGQQAQQKQQG